MSNFHRLNPLLPGNAEEKIDPAPRCPDDVLVDPAVNDTPQGLGQTWVQIPGANHPSASKV